MDPTRTRRSLYSLSATPIAPAFAVKKNQNTVILKEDILTGLIYRRVCCHLLTHLRPPPSFSSPRASRWSTVGTLLWPIFSPPRARVCNDNIIQSTPLPFPAYFFPSSIYHREKRLIKIDGLEVFYHSYPPSTSHRITKFFDFSLGLLYYFIFCSIFYNLTRITKKESAEQGHIYNPQLSELSQLLLPNTVLGISTRSPVESHL